MRRRGQLLPSRFFLLVSSFTFFRVLISAQRFIDWAFAGTYSKIFMKISRATIDQLEPIANLFDQYRQFYEQEANLDGCREYLRQRLENDESVIFIAQTDAGEIVAFTQLYRSFCSVAMQDIVYLYDLFVAPSARRQGVAQRLMDAAKVYGREIGASRLTLETAVDNIPAQALYESIGYKRNLEFYAYDLGLD